MSEPIAVRCPSCAAKFGVGPDQLGRTLTCPQCQRPFTAQAAGDAAVAAEPPVPPPVPPHAVGYATGGWNSPTPIMPFSGMAITSLVFGCLVFCFPAVPALLALGLGLPALGRTGPGRFRGRGLAIAGVSLGGVGLLVTVFQASILLPALNRARETANRARCATNLHQIGLAILAYQQSNGQEYPPDLPTLWTAQQSVPASAFVCPSASDTPPSTPADLVAGSGHLSYTYLKPPTNNAWADLPVMYESDADHRHDGMNILFGDGRAKWEPAASGKILIDSATAGVRSPITP